MYFFVKNIKKSYRCDNPVLKNLSFSMSKGEILSFVGESGSGKSTFLNCISGLENIDSGTIILNEKILNGKGKTVRAQDRRIGHVFQDNPLFPHLTLIKNILFNLKKIDKKNFDEVITVSGLKNLLTRFPHELSGGEKQRACIARAILREPDLLLLDEPFSNLDKHIKKDIVDYVEIVLQKKKITTILVTHDIKNILNISDKILIFKEGVLQQYDSPENMYCRPSNCYCGKLLGDLNELIINNKKFFIRPEHIKIVDKSNFSLIVEKSIYQGKDFKIKANHQNHEFYFYSTVNYKSSEKLYFKFDDSDLIYFDKDCQNYFT